MQNGDVVRISGEVKYGDTWYRVSSPGVIMSAGKSKSLVNISEIDGDENVQIFVENKYIKTN